MKKEFCVQCGKHVDYDVREIEQVEFIKKEKVSYKEKVAYCKDCGEPIWIEELEMENVFAPINAYCKIVGLISPKEIQEGLDRYNIGKRPLAQLLGWSDVTIVRFVDGQLPSKMYSDKLKEIFYNPESFLKLLEGNKEKISGVAYVKVKKTVEEILENQNGKIRFNIDMPTYQIITMSYSLPSKKDIRKVGERWVSPICYC